MVFGVGTSRGALLLYDLAQSKIVPAASLEVNSKGEPVYNVAFNTKK